MNDETTVTDEIVPAETLRRLFAVGNLSDVESRPGVISVCDGCWKKLEDGTDRWQLHLYDLSE